MTSNIRQFELALDAFAGEVEDFVGIVTRVLTIKINNRVVEMTPRDTGRAAGNWFPSVGDPSQRVELDRTTPVNPELELPNESATTKFPIMWITNNLPYIVPLNEGSSIQAPAGFVEFAVDYEVSQLK